MTMLAAMENW